jgi:transposase-like protein
MEKREKNNKQLDGGFRPFCPQCDHQMVKAGLLKWFKEGTRIGTQRYQCLSCGITTIKPNWKNLGD